MELPQNNTENDGQERKNFMKRKYNLLSSIYITAQFENPLEKREQFAVSLRKKKTQEIVKAKRRKIIEALSKGKKQYSGFGDSGNSVVELIPDNEVSLQDMENQFYQGFPKWRKDDYK
jgi:hypothetical protein